ncbi:MAG: class I SAM-dependent methyltransferase [Desulfocapsa sp.]|nr:class I SAM-dependent methyltransferase [Desulfocapsa sp.]
MQDKDEYHYAASIYDPLLSRSLRSIRNTISTFLKESRAKDVMDICCGTGEQLRLLKNEDMVLTGVDMSPAMLARAREKSPADIHYIETDATSLPLPDNNYDAALISFALHEKPTSHHTAIFAEACRIIKDDGFIVIADYSMPPSSVPSFVMGKILIPIVERIAGLDHYNNYKNWIDQGALEGFLQKNNPGKYSLIAPHVNECIKVYVVTQIKGKQ